MIEIIVVSDNHGDALVLKQIVKEHPHADAYLHCGDSEMSPEALEPFVAVMGNNDYYYEYPEYRVVQVGSYRIFMAHSHLLPYGKTTQALVSNARRENCDIACYGHTHRPDQQVVDGVTILNPGSLYYNRDGSPPSYFRVIIQGSQIQVEKLLAQDLRKAL